MPLVSEDFVKNAQALAEGVPALQAKLVEAEKKASEAEKTASARPDTSKLAPLAEATADTLIEHGLIPANEKSAAVAKLLSHEEAIQALNTTAQRVVASSMGGSEKSAGTIEFNGGSRDGGMKESDKLLLSRLGFPV